MAHKILIRDAFEKDASSKVCLIRVPCGMGGCLESLALAALTKEDGTTVLSTSDMIHTAPGPSQTHTTGFGGWLSDASACKIYCSFLKSSTGLSKAKVTEH